MVVVVAVITLGCQCGGGARLVARCPVVAWSQCTDTGPGPGRGWGGLCSVGQCGLQGEHSGHCQVSTSLRNWTCEEHSLSSCKLTAAANMLPDL